jgi:hypothetical protein
MYKLEIDTWLATVTVQSTDFSYISDIEAAVNAVRAKHEAEREKIYVTKQDSATLVRQPAKKRGRPVGSTNKARKAK